MTNFCGFRQLPLLTLWERLTHWWFGNKIYLWIFRKRSGRFSKFTMPIIKRVCPEFITKDFVSVQPMNEPSGKVFYLDFKHGEPNTKHYQQV